MNEAIDAQVRNAAFDFLKKATDRAGTDVLPRRVLAEGFDFAGRRVPLLGPQGIFKPAVLPELPLSITTVAAKEGKAAPYPDLVGSDGLLRYCYRGRDPDHHDNAGLRLAFRRQVPLVYCHGVVPGRYVVVWPVFIVGDSPGSLHFTVSVDERRLLSGDALEEEEAAAEGRRRYITRQVQHRLHQEGFRQRVLSAYQEHCAICRLRHAELLEAAHILPDGHPHGDPIVPNGLALCKLHHAAFDLNILGVRPDYGIEVREDVLVEIDGPMLKHGLQEFHGARLWTPRSQALRPRPEFLGERYESFRRAS